ncbi:MAG: putative lipid II flippase FtsW [Clostridiaceae bacterium]|nr:putative lipid II flippase FtsW [Clostridiaceae bacterium]
MSEIAVKNETKNKRPYSREIEETTQKFSGIDEPFTVLVLLLLVIGLVCLYSASYVVGYYSKNSDVTSTTYVMKQGAFALIGVVAMLVVSRMDYHKFHYFAIPLMVVSVLLLLSIKIVPGAWITINKATRWINLRVTSFQPSEITKFAFILFFSSWATIQGPKKMKKFKYGIFPFLIIMGVTAIMLYWQPHLSATVTIAGIGVVIIFLGGASIFWLLGIAGLGAAGITGYLIVNPYAMTRIKVWFDPFSDFLDKGWQGAQSLMSIASGGIWGLGLGQGRQKHLYLPEPANDFIFSVICEELGFVGAVLIMTLFAALILRGYYIASKAPDKFGTLLAAGVTSQIAIQTIFNIGVVSGLLPVTGASLPFFSYGGTSLLMLMAEVGVVLSVSRRTPPDQDKK